MRPPVHPHQAAGRSRAGGPRRCAASRMPVPVADRMLKLKTAASAWGSRDHRRHLHHQLVQAGDRDLRDPDPVEERLDLRHAPDEDENGEDRPTASTPCAPRRARRCRPASRGPPRRPRLRTTSRAAPRPSAASGARPAGTARGEPIEAMAATMSTSQGPWKLETRYCGTAKVTPATRSAGQISIILRKPTKAQISQNGTITEKNGSWRPIMPLSSMQVEPGDRGQRDDRRAERAEGDRRGIGDQRQARGGERREAAAPSAWRRVTATGVPKPAAPSKKAPKQKAMNRSCRRRSSEMSRIAALQDVELALLVGELVEEDDVEDDPADRHQPEAGAVDGGHARHACRHAEGEDRR